MLIGCLGLIKATVVILDYTADSEGNVGNQIKDFALSVELQIPVANENHLEVELEFIIRSIITGFFWHCILSYCMWLHKSVNERYSMKYELMLILICDLVTSALNFALLGSAVFRKTG